MEFALNNRLDVYDLKDQIWREAVVKDLKKNQAGTVLALNVLYRNFGPQYSVWIDTVKEAERILPVGSMSKAEGHAKHSHKIQQEIHEKMHSIIQKIKKFEPEKILSGGSWGVNFEPKESIDWQQEERRFRQQILTKNLQIHQVEGDGNCLFRAIAHQAYGDEELHKIVRGKCMDYIISEKDYFKDFIAGGGSDTSVEAYVARKRQNGVWGDDIEIQAISEIYDRPIEIYAYSKDPMRTYHEQMGSPHEPFRLSYHGASHYNSIIAIDWNYEKVFVKSEPGLIEDLAIQNSSLRESFEHQEQVSSLREKTEEETKAQDIRKMAMMIQRSREDFQVQVRRDMDEAMRRSLYESMPSKPVQPGSTALYRQLENENIQRAITESQQQTTEDDMLLQALEESKRQLERENLARQKGDPLSALDLDSALINTLMALSMNETVDRSQLSTGMQIALDNGFTIEQAMEAQSVVGDNPDMMLSYLFDKVSM